MEKFIFVDDEWNYLLVEWTTYKTFIRYYCKLMKDIAENDRTFLWFYDELEDMLSKKFKKDIKINIVKSYYYFD
jgi:hypothetical protein